MSRQQVGAHAAFAQSQEENWTVIDDAQERKRVQNRLAQRSYRQKVRERLQELDQLKTAEQGEGQWGGASTHTSTRRRQSAYQVKTATMTASTAPPPSTSTIPSESMALSDSTHFNLNFGDSSPSSSSGSTDKGKDGGNSSIEEMFADFCSNDGGEADAMATGSVGQPQKWATPLPQGAEYGFDLFGPLDSSGAPIQKPELRFTELMVRIRDVGFVDMESLILEYYSTQFRRDSLPYWLQRRSRQQNLCKLLEQLYMQSWSWPVEECVSFQCSIKRIAERVLSTENPSSESLGTFPFQLGNEMA